MLGEMAKSLPNEGGLLSKIVGDNDMTTFGENLTSFGEALVDFSQTVSAEGALNEEAVQKPRMQAIL